MGEDRCTAAQCLGGELIDMLRHNGVGHRTVSILTGNGHITTVRQLRSRTDDQLMAIEGFGPGMLDYVHERLEAQTATPDPLDMDGCSRPCRRSGKHTREYGGCAYGIRPELHVSMTYLYTAEDSYPAIGMQSYTASQLADLVIGEIWPEGDEESVPYDEEFAEDLALRVAQAIIKRNQGSS